MHEVMSDTSAKIDFRDFTISGDKYQVALVDESKVVLKRFVTKKEKTYTKHVMTIANRFYINRFFDIIEKGYIEPAKHMAQILHLNVRKEPTRWETWQFNILHFFHPYQINPYSPRWDLSHMNITMYLVLLIGR